MLRPQQRSTNIGLLVVKNPPLNCNKENKDDSTPLSRISGVAKAQHKLGHEDKSNFHISQSSTSTTNTTSTSNATTSTNQQNIQSQVYQELKQAKYLQRKAKRMRRVNQSKAHIKKEICPSDFSLYDHNDGKEKESTVPDTSLTTTTSTTTSKLGYKWENSEIFGEPGRSLLSKLTAKPQIEETEIDQWSVDLEKLYKPDTTETNESNMNHEIEEIDAHFELLFQNAKSGLVYTSSNAGHDDSDDDSFGSISFSESDTGYFQNFGNNNNNNIFPNSINNFSNNVVNTPNSPIKNNNNISNLSGSAASTPQPNGNRLPERYHSYPVTNLDELTTNIMKFTSPLQYTSDSETSDCELLEDSFDI